MVYGEDLDLSENSDDDAEQKRDPWNSVPLLCLIVVLSLVASL